MNPILAFSFVLLFILMMVFFAQIFWPIVLKTKTTSEGIEVSLFGLFPTVRIGFEEIIDVQELSLREMLPWSNPRSIGWLRLGTKFWSGGVLIRKKSGPFKCIVITPGDIKAFVNEVRKGVGQYGSKEGYGL